MAKRRRTSAAPTRKHVARKERERIQNRAIYLSTAVIVGLIAVLVLYAVISDGIIKPRQAVAAVNGSEIISRDFEARVRYERNNLVNQWYNTFSTMQQFGTDQNIQAFFVNNLNQVEAQLDPVPMGRAILNDMVEDVLIREEAEKLGITVTEEEVQEAFENFFGYFGGGYAPTPTSQPTTMPTSTFSPQQMALVTLTPTPFITPTATLEPEDEPEATPTPEGEPTATVTPFPTATPFSQEAYEEILDTSLTDLDRAIKFSEDDLRKIIENGLYRQKLFEEITKDIPRQQDQVWARHILVGDEATALNIRDRLINGEDFATLAAEFSTDESNSQTGGDLGWFGPGRMVAGFEQVAFNTEIGEISAPVQTQFGYHIIQVLGHEERPLTPTDYDQARQSEFDNWLFQLRQTADVELFDLWADRVPLEPNIPPNAAQLIQQVLGASTTIGDELPPVAPEGPAPEDQ